MEINRVGGPQYIKRTQNDVSPKTTSQKTDSFSVNTAQKQHMDTEIQRLKEVMKADGGIRPEKIQQAKEMLESGISPQMDKKSAQNILKGGL
ncbi:hypothetical protein [Candidatus Uabimicrobium amorphum]|uniref:Uncharacterized protein n=1 Tax=Uabimicrobium amorphum TaxID=2596890 RepID=A0A5S9F3Z4_UABAM|nr:hypothetical protein [Candidatus Uabimicrobium amorphum]BBM84992.1 hypothetical protein UABAM_03355 [Candidatus Uabimicrobium amorphum]